MFSFCGKFEWDSFLTWTEFTSPSPCPIPVYSFLTGTSTSAPTPSTYHINLSHPTLVSNEPPYSTHFSPNDPPSSSICNPRNSPPPIISQPTNYPTPLISLPLSFFISQYLTLPCSTLYPTYFSPLPVPIYPAPIYPTSYPSPPLISHLLYILLYLLYRYIFSRSTWSTRSATRPTVRRAPMTLTQSTLGAGSLASTTSLLPS